MIGVVRPPAHGRRVPVKTRMAVCPVEGRFALEFEMLRSVIARVLYTRYCAMELSTRIFASIQRLACAVHILAPRVRCSSRFSGGGARKPYWKRVAINRHEFHPKFSDAVLVARFAGGTGFPSTACSSSPRATVGSVVFTTTTVSRPVAGVPHDRSAFLASSGCLGFATHLTAATSPRSSVTPLSLAPAVARVHPCTCPLEAV